MIYIVNKKNYTRKGEYVGRPDILGNPFKIGIDGNREYVVNVLYRKWLWEQMNHNPKVYDELERLAGIARESDLVLICWCDPALCHASMVKKAIEWINSNR